MKNICLAFSKTDRSKYISHLDLMRVFQRAFYRADLPLRYTEGFNPHAYISIALPLSVGVESICERLLFGTSADIDSLPGIINPCLPEGIVVTGAAEKGRNFSEISFVRVGFSASLKASVRDLEQLFCKALYVDKRSKKGLVSVDITTLIKSITFESSDNGSIKGNAVLCAQNPSLNPEYIETAVKKFLDPEACFFFKRTEILDSHGELFDNLH